MAYASQNAYERSSQAESRGRKNQRIVPPTKLTAREQPLIRATTSAQIQLREALTKRSKDKYTKPSKVALVLLSGYWALQ